MKIRCTVENSDDLSNNARQFNLAICIELNLPEGIGSIINILE